MSKKKDAIRICVAELPKDEGNRSLPYTCPAGYKTIGIGFNIDTRNRDANGRQIVLHPDLAPYITGEEGLMMPDKAERILGEILDTEYDKCAGVFGSTKPYEHSVWDLLSPGQQASLLNMYFQLGHKRFTGFKRMIAAVVAGSWSDAQDEARDSLWYKQTQKSRTRRVIEGLAP